MLSSHSNKSQTKEVLRIFRSYTFSPLFILVFLVKHNDKKNMYEVEQRHATYVVEESVSVVPLITIKQF